MYIHYIYNKYIYIYICNHVKYEGKATISTWGSEKQQPIFHNRLDRRIINLGPSWCKMLAMCDHKFKYDLQHLRLQLRKMSWPTSTLWQLRPGFPSRSDHYAAQRKLVRRAPQLTRTMWALVSSDPCAVEYQGNELDGNKIHEVCPFDGNRLAIMMFCMNDLHVEGHTEGLTYDLISLATSPTTTTSFALWEVDSCLCWEHEFIMLVY